MHTDIDTLFTHLWDDYVTITPSAEKIHSLLKSVSGDGTLINDHVAFRTFNLEQTKLSKLAEHFESLGYKAKGDYNFETKKLTAKHFEHKDLTKPKIFISELRVEELSSKVQAIITSMVENIDKSTIQQSNFLYSGRHWNISKADYDTLLNESEYAAWMAAWGFRANHFTVSINHLSRLKNIQAVNDLLKKEGFLLNTSGGEIKGSKDVHLAQSSTMADKISVKFNDVTAEIPSCFYEFAERFEMASGHLYQGFVAASADKIFESTNAK